MKQPRPRLPLEPENTDAETMETEREHLQPAVASPPPGQEDVAETSVAVAGAAGDAGLPAETPAVSPPPTVFGAAWLGMAAVPRDGRTVYLARKLEDAKGVAAAFRRTRYYDREMMRWLVTVTWVSTLNGKRIDFEPAGWMDLPDGWAG